MNIKRFPAAVAAFLGCRDAFVANTARLATNDLAGTTPTRRSDSGARGRENASGQRPRQGDVLGRSGRSGAAHLGNESEPFPRRQRDARGPRRGFPSRSVARISAAARWPTPNASIARRSWSIPKLGEAHNNLAVVCLLTGRYPEADDEIKAAEEGRVQGQAAAQSRCEESVGATLKRLTRTWSGLSWTTGEDSRT